MRPAPEERRDPLTGKCAGIDALSMVMHTLDDGTLTTATPSAALLWGNNKRR